jgi:hypothetical protein
MHASTATHWADIKCIMRAMYKPPFPTGLHIRCGDTLSLYGFIDADWASSVDDQKFTGGYLVFLSSTTIS